MFLLALLRVCLCACVGVFSYYSLDEISEAQRGINCIMLVCPLSDLMYSRRAVKKIPASAFSTVNHHVGETLVSNESTSSLCTACTDAL